MVHDEEPWVEEEGRRNDALGGGIYCAPDESVYTSLKTVIPSQDKNRYLWTARASTSSVAMTVMRW